MVTKGAANDFLPDPPATAFPEGEFFYKGNVFATDQTTNGFGLQLMVGMDVREPLPGIETRDLRVDFGSFTAVDDLSMRIPKGEIYGLIGPNGAGKTTTFRALATLQQPTYGEMFVEGVDVAAEPAQARRLLGYMPDLAPVPSDLKVWEFLDLFGAAHGVSGRVRRERIANCLEAVDLVDKRNIFCGTLSRGMTQRCVLAKSLLHRPRVLILDEPASGMDPVSRKALRGILRRVAAEGTTILISSHILSELSDLCTRVGILARGQLLDSGRPGDVADRLGRSKARVIRINLLSGEKEAVALLGNQKGVGGVRQEGASLVFEYEGSLDEQVGLLRTLTDSGMPIRSFEERTASIEDVIVALHEKQLAEDRDGS